MIAEWIRFGLVALFLVAGTVAMIVSILGIYRFDFALNRIHSAAVADTLSMFLYLIGLLIYVGPHPIVWKLLLVLAMQWTTAPLSSHLLTQFEYRAVENLSRHVALPPDLAEDEEAQS